MKAEIGSLTPLLVTQEKRPCVYTDFWHLDSVKWEGKPWEGTWACPDDWGVRGSGRSQEWLQGSQGSGGGWRSGAETWAPGEGGGRCWYVRRCCSTWPVCHTRGKGSVRWYLCRKVLFRFVLIREKLTAGPSKRRTSGLRSETLNSHKVLLMSNRILCDHGQEQAYSRVCLGYPCGFFNEEKDEPALDLIGCLGSGWDLLHILWQQTSFLIAKDSLRMPEALEQDVLDSDNPQIGNPWL